MILETIAAIVVAAAGAAVLASLGLDAIRGWLRQRAANRYGDLVRRQLQNGNVEVVAIGLKGDGTRTGQHTWKAKSLDSDLESAFGYGNTARITL